LINPVTTWGEVAFTTVLHKVNVLQFPGVTLFAAAANIQYSTPDAMVHETVALASPGTTLTSAGAGAGAPLLPHPARSRVAVIAKKNAESRFISIPLLAPITRSLTVLSPMWIRCQGVKRPTSPV
jgi:hypothetical protein